MSVNLCELRCWHGGLFPQASVIDKWATTAVLSTLCSAYCHFEFGAPLSSFNSEILFVNALENSLRFLINIPIILSIVSKISGARTFIIRTLWLAFARIVIKISLFKCCDLLKIQVKSYCPNYSPHLCIKKAVNDFKIIYKKWWSGIVLSMHCVWPTWTLQHLWTFQYFGKIQNFFNVNLSMHNMRSMRIFQCFRTVPNFSNVKLHTEHFLPTSTYHTLYAWKFRCPWIISNSQHEINKLISSWA
jgi:hypothetical protein